MSEWQPIETAPKDGTELLMWCGRPVCGYWSGDNLDPERDAEGWIVDWNWPGMTRPTHWMHLPKGPSA